MKFYLKKIKEVDVSVILDLLIVSILVIHILLSDKTIINITEIEGVYAVTFGILFGSFLSILSFIRCRKEKQKVYWTIYTTNFAFGFWISIIVNLITPLHLSVSLLIVSIVFVPVFIYIFTKVNIKQNSPSQI